MEKTTELWNILCELVEERVPRNGLYCTPITGGLDSRVLAGIMKKLGRNIRLSYWIREPRNAINEIHIQKIRELVVPEYFYIVHVQKLPDDFTKAIVDLSMVHPIGMYSFVMALHMDVYTGMFKTKKKEREYFYKTWHRMHTNDYLGFKEILLPFESTRLVGYLMSLPRTDRLFQKIYMKMIQEYLPEYAKIPRCFEKGTGRPVPIEEYYRYLLERGVQAW